MLAVLYRSASEAPPSALGLTQPSPPVEAGTWPAMQLPTTWLPEQYSVVVGGGFGEVYEVGGGGGGGVVVEPGGEELAPVLVLNPLGLLEVKLSVLVEELCEAEGLEEQDPPACRRIRQRNSLCERSTEDGYAQILGSTSLGRATRGLEQRACPFFS